MKILTLKRLPETITSTFGVLWDCDDNIPLFLTVERKWLDNKPFVSQDQPVSCIPVGEYNCTRGIHNLDGHTIETFEVKNVPERTGILFHKGNTFADSRGCIVVGSSFAFIGGVYGLRDSGLAFDNFMQVLKNHDDFKLVIQEV